LSDSKSYARTDDDGLDRPSVPVNQSSGVTIEDDDTAHRTLRLSLESPAVYILPRNFEAAPSADDFVFEALTSTLQKLGRQAGIDVAVPGPRDYRSIHEKDAQFTPGAGSFTLYLLDQREAPVIQVGDPLRQANFEIGRFDLTPRAVRMLEASLAAAIKRHEETTGAALPSLADLDARSHFGNLERLLDKPVSDETPPNSNG
jgi:hypothetical protein